MFGDPDSVARLNEDELFAWFTTFAGLSVVARPQGLAFPPGADESALDIQLGSLGEYIEAALNVESIGRFTPSVSLLCTNEVARALLGVAGWIPRPPARVAAVLEPPALSVRH